MSVWHRKFISTFMHCTPLCYLLFNYYYLVISIHVFVQFFLSCLTVNYGQILHVLHIHFILDIFTLPTFIYSIVYTVISLFTFYFLRRLILGLTFLQREFFAQMMQSNNGNTGKKAVKRHQLVVRQDDSGTLDRGEVSDSTSFAYACAIVLFSDINVWFYLFLEMTIMWISPLFW